MERFAPRRHARLLLALAGWRPGKAAMVAWWWLIGKRVRALARLRAGLVGHPDAYRIWLMIHQVASLPARDLAILRAETAGLPAIAVHLHLGPGADGAAAAATSVLRQFYPRWTLYVTTPGPLPALSDDLVNDPRVATPVHAASRAEGLALVLAAASESHLVPLSPAATLTPGALMAFARVLGEGISRDTVLYADQDEAWPRGRAEPWLKPAWDYDLFLAQDYVSAACALPVAAARSVEVDPAWSDPVAVYALVARLLATPTPVPVHHVPYVAVTTAVGAWRRESLRRADVVAASTGLPVRAGPFGTLAVVHPLPSPPPLVSVIVPTRDRVDLLRTCVAGVLESTDYPALELVIVDNGSREPETLAFIAERARDPRVAVLRWPHPYNYAAINNFAARHAAGAYLCLLNNDTEVIEPTWLAELVAQAARPGVGAAGARLFYPDRTIQHAGVVIGMGNAAGHAHRGLPDGAPGYFAQALVAHEASAVTAACLVVARDKFMRVGGLDEAELGIAYNDVDLCLKLHAAGWRNLYVPQAVLIHHESKSRGHDFAPEHLARYLAELAVLQARWGTVGYIDPAHHPALDPASETYRMRL